MNRRSFLTKTAGGILVAPALIREGFAMPVKPELSQPSTPRLHAGYCRSTDVNKGDIIQSHSKDLLWQWNGHQWEQIVYSQ